MVAGSYNIPHTLLEGYCVYTNQVPGGYFRAPGETQNSFRGGEPYRHDGPSDGHRPAGISVAQWLKRATRGPLARVLGIPIVPSAAARGENIRLEKKPSHESGEAAEDGSGHGVG